MAEFYYRALTPQGQIIRSKIEDSSRLSCIRRLRRNGLTPISVRPAVLRLNTDKNKIKKTRNIKQNAEFQTRLQARSNSRAQKTTKTGIWDSLNRDIGGGKRITARDIRVFTQNFYLLKKANFNNIHALSTVIDSTENPRLRIILADILAGVEAGEYMYTTMEYYSNVFPYIYINMIRVGELSGSLDNSLEQAVEYLENSDALRRRVRKIVLPNLFMFIALTLGTIFGVLFGVPLLKNIFDEVGSKEQLPAITMWVYNATIAVRTHWYIPTTILILIVGVFFIWLRTPRGRYNFDYFKYTMPIFGKLKYLLDFHRLMQCVLLNLQNGMRIQDALEVSKNVVKNTVMMSMVEIAINNIFVGQSWIEPFEESKLGDTMCIEMLKIGMQTDLPEMIAKMIDYIEIDITNTLERIMKVLPEVSYLFVGIVLIFFVVAVLVPCINLYMGGWLFSAYDV